MNAKVGAAERWLVTSATNEDRLDAIGLALVAQAEAVERMADALERIATRLDRRGPD